MEKWLEKKIVALCNIIMEHMPHIEKITVLDGSYNLTTDRGNEYIVFIHAHFLSALGLAQEESDHFFETVDDLIHLTHTKLEESDVLDSSGDYAETAEQPIRMNTSVIFPITWLK